MKLFSLILDHEPAASSVEGVFSLIADALPDSKAVAAYAFEHTDEAEAARLLGERNPDTLMVVAHALAERMATLHSWPRSYRSDIAAIKRISADALAPRFTGNPGRSLQGERLRIAIMVPWLPNNPNNNLLRVAAGYAAGLLRQAEVEDAVIVVTNEFATAGKGVGESTPATAKPKADARAYRTTHSRALAEFGAPADKVLYAPPPFADGGNVQWHVDFDREFRPNVVFVPNVEMTSATIHGFAHSAATVYLQTSLNNRPSYDFDRYLYLGRRRELDNTHIHRERWHYHSFGYEAFGFGSDITRASMGFAETDFIIVSAGNRLETEITSEISEIVASVLGDDPARKWLLLGARDEARIRENMGAASDRIGNRAVFKDYVWEVGDYLANCDVYANPRRTGGAVSMALAVYGNTPVISFDGNDACNFLLDEMICDSPEQFKEHLGRLANDPAYRSDVATRQMEHFRAGHTVDASCADLVRHFHAAIASRAGQ